MRALPDCKFQHLVLGSVATNATATANIDTKGWKYLTVAVNLDTQASTTSNPAVLKLAESNDTVVTNFADITGFVGDTSFTIPDAETTKTSTVPVVLHMDLRGRKRYIRFSATSAGAAQIMGGIAILSNGDLAATNATQRGALVSAVG